MSVFCKPPWNFLSPFAPNLLFFLFSPSRSPSLCQCVASIIQANDIINNPRLFPLPPPLVPVNDGSLLLRLAFRKSPSARVTHKSNQLGLGLLPAALLVVQKVNAIIHGVPGVDLGVTLSGFFFFLLLGKSRASERAAGKRDTAPGLPPPSPPLFSGFHSF